MMGLFRLLTLPVSGPVLGTAWLLDTLLQEAERQWYDTGAIRQELGELQARYQRGEVDDREFERQEELLLERLLEAHVFHEPNRPGDSAVP